MHITDPLKRVISDPDLSLPARFLYVLIEINSKDGISCIGQRRLRKLMRIRMEKVAAAIGELESSGHISVEHDDFQRSTYTLIAKREILEARKQRRVGFCNTDAHRGLSICPKCGTVVDSETDIAKTA